MDIYMTNLIALLGRLVVHNEFMRDYGPNKTLWTYLSGHFLNVQMRPITLYEIN